MSDTKYRSKWERELAYWVKARGWEVLERNAQGHLAIQYPITGARFLLPGAGYRMNLLRKVHCKIKKLEAA